MGVNRCRSPVRLPRGATGQAGRIAVAGAQRSRPDRDGVSLPAAGDRLPRETGRPPGKFGATHPKRFKRLLTRRTARQFGIHGESPNYAERQTLCAKIAGRFFHLQ